MQHTITNMKYSTTAARSTLVLSLLLILAVSPPIRHAANAFSPNRPTTRRQQRQKEFFRIYSSDKDISTMRVKEIKEELDSMNISYTDCFDKDSLATKLRQARAGEIKGGGTSTSKKRTSQSSSSSRNDDEAVAVNAELFMDFDPNASSPSKPKPSNVMDAIIDVDAE